MERVPTANNSPAFLLKQSSQDCDLRFYGLCKSQPDSLLEPTGLAEYVEVIEKYSAFAMPQLITEQRKYDLRDGRQYWGKPLKDF